MRRPRPWLAAALSGVMVLLVCGLGARPADAAGRAATPGSFAVTATIDVGSFPYGVAVTPNGAYAYVTNFDSGTVSVISTATNTVTATVPVGGNPFGVAMSPDGTHVYVANFDSDTVSVISTATSTVTATIPVGDFPYGVAMSPDGAYAYITNDESGTVSVIDTGTNTVTATIPVGRYATGVAVSPDGTHAYVANGGSGTVSVITYTPPAPPPPPPGGGLAVTTTSPLPPASLGHRYTLKLAATGGTAPYSWSRASGELPRGLHLSTDGTISGTPIAYGTYTYTARVTDYTGATTAKTLTLAVTPRADLAIHLAHTGSFQPGHTAHLTVTATNRGTQQTATARRTRISVTVPAGLRVTSGGTGHWWHCRKDRHGSYCTRDRTIQPGAPTTIIIPVKVTAGPGRTLTITARITPTDSTWHDNSANTTITT